MSHSARSEEDNRSTAGNSARWEPNQAPQPADDRATSGSVGTVAGIRTRARLGYLARLLFQPLMFFCAGLALLVLLGIAQKAGWISASGGSAAGVTTRASLDADYICPMMCTPPQQEPGRCPVCAMELVPASGGGGNERTVFVDPATRRVANIKTVAVLRVPLGRTIRAVGKLTYDEGTMRTISAYTRGRFDRLYVDYTGANVQEGDRLASFYSPDLYSAQVEYLQASDSIERRGSLAAVQNANRQLRASAGQRLIEFGMSADQIEQLARSRQALSRLDIVAPIQGTVIEKLVVEGEYVKAGQPVFRLADFSTVWLMLELFPQDAAAVRYGQSVEATLKSLPGKTITGRIAFIAPEVDEGSRTVSVRVVLENRNGLIRIGDYAKASIDVPLGRGRESLVYDPELATKWISPRHPHVVSDGPGQCRLCGIEMVPASDLGFTDRPQAETTAHVVPRSAVLSAANQSVVYVETASGRFEIRRVVTGPTSGDQVVIEKGLSEGERVASSGGFLLDSQMQLAGNPSLIDPSRAAPPLETIAGFVAEELAEIRQLPQEDQQLAIEQMICPVTDYKLGSMGIPPKAIINGQPIFLCCEGCRGRLLNEPAAYLAKLEMSRSGGPAFEVAEMGAIAPVETGDLPALPEIRLIEANDDHGFEIEVPDF